MKKWIEMAQEVIDWLKVIAERLEATNALLKEVVVSQRQTQQQIMTISKIYLKAGETPSAEQIAAEAAHLQKARGAVR